MINRKLDYLRGRIDKGDIVIDEFEICCFIDMINEKFGDEIEAQPCLRATIDFLFETNARHVLLDQFKLYVGLFVIPFIL